MRTLASIAMLVAVVVLGTALGIGSAYLAVRSPAPIDATSAGAWQAWPNAGTPDADPYSRARLARNGEIPLGSGEGLSLLAEGDDAGAPFRGVCDYEIAGMVPPARLWTIAVETSDGRAVSYDGQSAAIGSDSLLRESDGAFLLELSNRPKPGNWIPTTGLESFRVVVRLYDTTARLVTALTTLTMPTVSRGACAA